jgi:hypothetical protein
MNHFIIRPRPGDANNPLKLGPGAYYWDNETFAAEIEPSEAYRETTRTQFRERLTQNRFLYGLQLVEVC